MSPGCWKKSSIPNTGTEGAVMGCDGGQVERHSAAVTASGFSVVFVGFSVARQGFPLGRLW